mgnify:CR=1 FL=1
MDNYDTGIYTDNPDDTLRYMRSTQAVSMVRCKDCKYMKARSMDGNSVRCGKLMRWTDNDFYCADGKRR